MIIGHDFLAKKTVVLPLSLPFGPK